MPTVRDNPLGSEFTGGRGEWDQRVPPERDEPPTGATLPPAPWCAEITAAPVASPGETTGAASPSATADPTTVAQGGDAQHGSETPLWLIVVVVLAVLLMLGGAGGSVDHPAAAARSHLSVTDRPVVLMHACSTLCSTVCPVRPARPSLDQSAPATDMSFRSRLRGRLRRPSKAVVSVLAVAVAATGVGVAAAQSDGYSIEAVEPTDGAVWVTNDRTGFVGRLNKPAHGLDAALPAADSDSDTHQLDMIQAGATVVARDRVGARLIPVDVRKGQLVSDKSILVQPSLRVSAGGGTVAVLDPTTGVVRASRAGTDQIAAVDTLREDAKPVAVVKVADEVAPTRAAGQAVGDDGVVSVVGSGGQLVTLTPRPNGTFAVASRDLGAGLQDAQVGLVGREAVVVDTIGLVAVLPDGDTTALPAGVRDGIVQRPDLDGGAHPDARLLISSRQGLFALDPASGETQQIFTGVTGSPAAPAVARGCRYAAWTGTPGTAARQCVGQGGSEAAALVALAGSPTLLAPQIRVNRGTVVLNDSASGAVWDLDTGARLDNWTAVAPPATSKPKKTTKGPTLTQTNRKPKAVDDDLGARPGRTSVLHVLDNDTNPAGSVLSIVGVTQPSAGTASTSISPDGQAVQVTMQPGSGSVSFSYTIDDGKGSQSSAKVTVRARVDGDNGPPALRQGFQPKGFAVASQGRLSVPVIGDWRDPDSDPVVLAAAEDAGQGTDAATPVPVSADGRIQYTAPTAAGARQLSYTVSDGRATTEGKVGVQVLAKDSTAATSPTTLPDVAKGEVNAPIEVTPLDNDLPGADPSSPEATLQIASEVVAPTGLTAETNLKTGTVTVTAAAPGTHLLTYTARYGDAPYARGTIRVDVTPPKDKRAAPVAMLDQAVVYGESAATVDVLANDYNPSGRLLAVQQAEAVDGASFEVAVIRGRWLRITPTRPDIKPNPGRVRYTITDGIGPSVDGEVSVQQLPRPKDATPSPVDDHAVVRSGDSTVVAVIDNDTHPAGDPLRLVAHPDPESPAGLLTVLGPQPQPGATPGEGEVGAAYVVGNVVRYQAPRATQPTTMRVPYVVQDPSLNRAAGTAYITVVPDPTPQRPNQAPTPPAIEARIVAGGTMQIQVATTGSDPEGDSVTLQGIDSAPHQGRILAMSPSSLTYQAYPTSAETVEFTYVVVDRFGKTGIGTIRVAVLPPGDPQPPVAVDDLVTASPKATVTFDPVTNDIVAIGDTVRIQPLEGMNPELPVGTKVDLASARMTVVAPDAVGAGEIRYAVRGASGVDTVASVRVRAQEGYNNPPVARNAYATPGEDATEVSVDVLRSASDPEGSPLRVTRVFNAPGSRINGGAVTVPVAERPQVLGYEIEDAEGARSMATIFVPPVGAGVPYVKPDSLIKVDKNSSQTVDLDEVLVSPSGRPLILTTVDRMIASPAGVAVRPNSKSRVTVSTSRDYVGPAAVTFEVTDGSSAADPQGRRGLVTVPVQVGPETPVLRCPPTDIAVVQGGRSRPVSIPELCHVWTAQPGQASQLQFVGRFPGNEPGLAVTNQGRSTLVISASGDAKPGTSATLSVTVPGSEVTPARMRVFVTPATAPTVSPILLQGVRAGTTKSVNISSYVRSQLGNPQVRVVRVEKVSGTAATVTQNGPTTISVSPDARAKGRIVYKVTVTDVANTNQTDRYGVGSLTVDVLGPPDAPVTPYQSGASQSHAVRLAWGTPANNGLPISHYTVTWAGGSKRCSASPCQITGLDNGTAYQFTVTAHNAVGASQVSKPSAKITPDAVPGAPTEPTTSGPQDGRLTVAWGAAPVDGTPVTKYLVTWPGGRTETQSTSIVATGLDNNAVTTFTIKASNAAGWGPGVTVRGQSAGKPATPGAPSVSGTQVAGGAEQAFAVSWKAVSPNGPGPTTYTVTRTGGGRTTTVCSDVTKNSCSSGAVTNDGSSYSFSVTASNTVNSSSASPAQSIVAAGPPGDFTKVSASATGQSRKVDLSFTSPPARDSGLTITCSVSGTSCGSWTTGTAPEQISSTITVGENGTTPTITLVARNRTDQTSAATVQPDTGYGPPTGAAISNLASDGPYVSFTASADAQGKQAKVAVTVSVGGTVVQSYDANTGGGAWSDSYRLKIGYDETATVSLTVSRGNDKTSDSQSVTTGSGSVALSGERASTCQPDQPCDDRVLTVAVSNVGSNNQVSCRIEGQGQADTTVGITTGGQGNGSTGVPEDALLGKKGQTYTAVCDDATKPDAPVRTEWTAQ